MDETFLCRKSPLCRSSEEVNAAAPCVQTENFPKVLRALVDAPMSIAIVGSPVLFIQRFSRECTRAGSRWTFIVALLLNDPYFLTFLKRAEFCAFIEGASASSKKYRMMVSFRKLGLVILILVDPLVRDVGPHVVSARRRITVAEREFYAGPFGPCKGTKLRNPVESVRANVFATKFFNALGFKNALKLFSRYGVPSFAFYPLGDLTCLLDLLTYAILSKNEDLTLPKNYPPEQYFGLMVRILAMCEISAPSNVTVRRHGKKFTMPWSDIKEIFSVIVPLVIQVNDGRVPQDVNFLLHTVEYFRGMLS